MARLPKVNVLRFNPRAREGRDNGGFDMAKASYVSIHAPARGATGEGECAKGCLAVSIHAPARGATVFIG